MINPPPCRMKDYKGNYICREKAGSSGLCPNHLQKATREVKGGYRTWDGYFVEGCITITFAQKKHDKV